MATIGIIKIGISTATAGLTKGLNKARGEINNFGKSLTSTKSLVGGVLGAIGVGLSTAAFVSFVKGAADSIDNVSKLADRLGTTTENFTGLAHAANLSGVSQETLAGAMGKLQKLLGEGNPKAIETLNQMGLSAEHLKSIDPVDAVKLIADGLNNIPNSADRAAATMDLFGKSGQQLGNLLMSGSEGIAAAQSEAEKLGLTYSRVDGAKVEAANDALTKQTAIWTGLGQSIAVEVAPYVTALTDQLVAFLTQGEGIKSIVGKAFEILTNSIIVAADAWDFLYDGFKLVQSYITKEISYIVKGISGIVSAINLIPGIEIDTSVLDEISKDLDSLASDQWNQIGTSGGGDSTRKFFSSVESGANKSAQAIADAAAKQRDMNSALTEGVDAGQKLIDKLTEQVATFGMSSTEAEIYKLAQEGASTATLEQARSLASQLSNMEANKKAEEELANVAKSFTDEFTTPLEKIQKQTEDLIAARDKGLISEDIFSRASEKLKADAQAAGGQQEVQSHSVSAITLGSSEAFAALDRLRGVSSGGDNSTKQLGEQQKANSLLTQILRALNSSSVDPFALNTA